MTIGQAREVAALFRNNPQACKQEIGSQFIGKVVIIRTYSAGVWFGILSEKSGNEVILAAARRMWRWWAAESISLSAVAVHGINREKSKIAGPVDSVWLEAIEIIPVTDAAFESINGAAHAKAE
ncbi:hypothetical protein EW367_22535 [Salmonella enterica subsp. enterica serovar Fufu]|nr:hypothetical protein [Salmonella enterica subsp. enterica serovar Fufu]